MTKDRMKQFKLRMDGIKAVFDAHLSSVDDLSDVYDLILADGDSLRAAGDNVTAKRLYTICQTLSGAIRKIIRRAEASVRDLAALKDEVQAIDDER